MAQVRSELKDKGSFNKYVIELVLYFLNLRLHRRHDLREVSLLEEVVVVGTRGEVEPHVRFQSVAGRTQILARGKKLAFREAIRFSTSFCTVSLHSFSGNARRGENLKLGEKYKQ